MPIHDIKAIDVHAHYGPCPKENSEVLSRLMSQGAAKVAERAKMANTEITFVSATSALLPLRKNDPVTWNENASEDIRPVKALRFWVVVDPTKMKTYEQAKTMLKLPHCIGIKIHPEGHGYPISRYGKEIFTFALEEKAIVLSHSGQENSVPEEFAPFANDFPEVTIIIAHLGNTWDGNPTHQVLAVQKAKYGNLYIDTSSSMNTLGGLLEWAVQEIGADRLLYGTDSPLYFAPMQRSRIDYAEMGDSDKKKILRDNALRLFQSKL